MTVTGTHHRQVEAVSVIYETHQPRRRLRSSDNSQCVKRKTRTAFGKRSVDVAAPTAWNSLASYLHRIDDTATFKRYLKTYPFALAFKFKMFIIVIFF